MGKEKKCPWGNIAPQDVIKYGGNPPPLGSGEDYRDEVRLIRY
jgi:hypothetical protein